MESEIYAFETWFSQLKIKTRGEKVSRAASVIAQEIKLRYGINVWFAEILGKRWSYLGGEGHEFPSPSLSSLPLSTHYGIVAEHWEQIPPHEGTRLLDFLKEYFQKLDTHGS